MGLVPEQESKVFFFGKKNQKTFPTFGRACPRARPKGGKVFLLLFLQKKKILPSLDGVGGHARSTGQAAMPELRGRGRMALMQRKGETP